MDVTAVVNIVAGKLMEEPGIEGAFLHNSVMDNNRPDSTHIDIGVVSKDSLKDLRKAYGLHEEILQVIGQPVYVAEYAQSHNKEVRALFGRSAYPPLGLSVRLVFCQLKHAGEQDICEGYRLLFDRSGAVKEQLMQAQSEAPDERLARELKEQLHNYPFHLHDAAEALAHKNRAGAQSATEQMRRAIYSAAVARTGQHDHCAERGWQALAPSEKWVLENTFQAVTAKTLERLTNLYINCLSSLQTEYHLELDVEQLKQALTELI
jgi:hypothetical protein